MYFYQKEYPEALIYFEKALKIWLQIGRAHVCRGGDCLLPLEGTRKTLNRLGASGFIFWIIDGKLYDSNKNCNRFAALMSVWR